MRMTVIGSLDAVRGFALAGVSGTVVETTEEVHRALDAALDDPTCGIILITEDVANLARERVDALTWRSSEQDVTPLVVEIPGPNGPDPDRPSLGEMIRKTTGVRI